MAAKKTEKKMTNLWLVGEFELNFVGRVEVDDVALAAYEHAKIEYGIDYGEKYTFLTDGMVFTVSLEPAAKPFDLSKVRGE